MEGAVQALTGTERGGESLAELAHDARNMVAALGLYCDLLEEPGVLNSGYAHYGEELRLVASASRRLVDKLAALDRPDRANTTAQTGQFWRNQGTYTERWPATLAGGYARELGDPVAPGGVENLAAELLATRSLLSALAGPSTVVMVDAQGGARAARINAEDLTRVMVNLVKNAVEAMPTGGRILIWLREKACPGGIRLQLTVEDNGPGIPEDALDRVFESGYTGHTREDGRPLTHRGLGLAITRAIIEASGGSIHAENRAEGGAKLVMELPARE